MMRRLICVAAALALAACGTTQHKPAAPVPASPRAPVAAHPKAVDLPALPAAGSGRGGYYLDDGPGDNPPPGLRDVPDAVVKAEVLSKYGNRPYVVFGKTYTPVTGDAPFTQRGVASWYGKKFHGQRTSSGELYDMYKMTAAHPTLPIPSYARITSLATGKSVVVRVNDRGPFHSSRVVDVSYTAALKLGLLGKGSHEVEIERLFAGRPEQPTPVTTLVVEEHTLQENEARVEAAPLVRRQTDGFYLQLGAFGRQESAAGVRSRVLASGAVEQVEVVQAGAVHRLYGGPFASRDEALKAARALPSTLGIKPIVVRRSAD
ncbi:septal ring lytic transglycosylase RlpA family protein [Massilia sp. R2A-15]|uniref:septal ring lytic transglycosylase RlpA family protein n=1 Tax=Massilia sp. R2A-15 TaxID=3064278 RepID=UPI002732CF12|nr:septal ring lytic transglycosylase RlpA family protein [Massilia sp. R2A-15]WLI89694.1 septal ring lytic transglycosylase RlpA family protein [Massilia sp. R2A-15]